MVERAAGASPEGTLASSAATERRSAGESGFVRIEQVSHWYELADGMLHALDRVTLELGGADFVSIVGPSGCGKSTLLMLLAGLIKPSRGRITIADQPVVRPFESLGVVFQTDLLLDWLTILDNVLLQSDIRHLDRQAAKQRALQLLATAHLAGFEKQRPWELSGGMRQRVAICRALLHHPRLLLMDEPFGALDALTREKMGRFLQAIWLEERPAVLFITHSVEEAVFLSDRVVVMSARPGRIVEEIHIALPRPRDSSTRTNPAYLDYTSRILAYFEESEGDGP
jgi:NitT/TauT family transport system ATP-binding protein